MNQQARSVQMSNVNPDIQTHELNSVENSIMTLLQAHHQQDQIIDVSWLQAECNQIGFSPKEFSHGFVRLLMRGHLEPRGEFEYALHAGGSGRSVMENAASYGSGATKAEKISPSLPPQSLEASLEPQQKRTGILLVDDDEDVRSVIAAMLEAADYQVFSMDNGSNAIEFFQENQDAIDLLMSDVLMPVMNGSELYGCLNRLRPGLPTVFISGHPSNFIKHLQAEKNVKFLAKPLRQSTLVKTIKDVLNP